MIQSAEENIAHDAGFTIIELLVTLTLVALVLAMTPSLVGMAGRGLRVAGELTRGQSDVAALDAIGDKLSEARPLTKLQDDNTRRVQFSGTSNSVKFVAPGVVHSYGGLLTYELGLVRTAGGGSVLALRRYPFHAEDPDSPPSGGDLRTPMPATTRLAFRYYGPQGDDGAMGWTDNWESASYLPQLVEIRTQSRWAYAPQIRTVIAPLRFYQKPPRVLTNASGN